MAVWNGQLFLLRTHRWKCGGTSREDEAVSCERISNPHNQETRKGFYRLLQKVHSRLRTDCISTDGPHQKEHTKSCEMANPPWNLVRRVLNRVCQQKIHASPGCPSMEEQTMVPDVVGVPGGLSNPPPSEGGPDHPDTPWRRYSNF